MHKLLIPAFLITCLALGAAVGCGTTEDGPKFFVDLNTRNLCNYNVSVETESRCMVDGDCGGTQTCWFSSEEHFKDKKGFCHQCQEGGACPGATEQCDHGQCHEVCAGQADCGTGEFCTDNFCRKPHVGSEFSFCNRGNKDLEVYLDQVTLHGNDEACVFSRFEWAPAGDTAILAPDDCSLYLNAKFTPKDVGEFRGFIKIPNNSIDHSPMLILLCGQAVESVCSVSDDGTCPECASCLLKDFEAILESEPIPDCASYF